MAAQKGIDEKGQAIVLIVLAMVVLLGMTAVAVDGSMIYADRRYGQSVSDSASLAGAVKTAEQLDLQGVSFSNWDCHSSAVKMAAKAGRIAAIQSAGENTISLDQDVSDRHGVTTECITSYSQGFGEKYMDVITQVTVDTATGFAHFVYDGEMRNTTEAVARVKPRSSLARGYAIVALNPDDCQGMNTGAEFHGTADTVVKDGGVFTNGCLRGVGNQATTVENAPIHYRGEYINTGGSSFSPAPQPVSFRMTETDYAIPEPDCNHPNAHRIDGKDLRGTLEPGLYCVDGKATINAHDTLYGIGVTIVMLNDRLHMDGHADVRITAPGHSPDPTPAIPGVLIYAPPDTNYRDANKNGLLFNGNSDSYFSGIILAPALDVYINGTSRNDAYRTQVIGWNVQIGGTADTSVLFSDNYLYLKPPSIELYR